jgi:hypothetical protein
MKPSPKSCALRVPSNATAQLSQLPAQPDRNQSATAKPISPMTATDLRAQLRRNRTATNELRPPSILPPESCAVAPPATAAQPSPWPGYRRWQIRRASGEQFGVFVPKGATIPEMTAFYCGCVCVPER